MPFHTTAMVGCRPVILTLGPSTSEDFMILIPKNWKTFQHYKDRSPPWVKLHKNLLDDRDFMRLPIASKALAPLLWLLASESKDGSFDASMDELSFRLRLTQKELTDGLKPLIDNGFFLDASTMLAPCLQVAVPETEGETEKRQSRAIALPTPDGVSDDVWQSFLKIRKAKKAPMSDLALAGIKREADSAGWTLEDALSECVTRGWQSFKADWVEKKKASQSGILAGAI